MPLQPTMAELSDFVGTWRAEAAASRPTRFEMQIGDPWLEDGLLLFHVNGSPYITEFSLVGSSEAVVGAAVGKLPPELAGPDHQRSIEAHRVQLTRQSETTLNSKG